MNRSINTEIIECSGEAPNIIVFDRTRWQRFKIWLSKRFIAEGHNETSSVGRGQ
jgi:hypothetical protein